MLPLIAILAVIAALVRAQHWCAGMHLKRWAKESRLHLARVEKTYAQSGPFTGRHWQGQFVCRIRAVNSNGEVRIGWVRVGHWLFGAFANEVLAIWDQLPVQFAPAQDSPQLTC
jgi:hypothetical protein